MDEEAVIQNLKDAGCGTEIIHAFMADLHKGKPVLGMKRLAAHRRALLDALHEEQRRIDCLDYLVFQLEKAAKPQFKK